MTDRGWSRGWSIKQPLPKATARLLQELVEGSGEDGIDRDELLTGVWAARRVQADARMADRRVKITLCKRQMTEEVLDDMVRMGQVVREGRVYKLPD